MTGFSRKVFQEDGYNFNLTIRSVNSRFLEINFFGLMLLPELEKKIRKQIKERISRGKIDIFLEAQKEGETAFEPEINLRLLEKLIDGILQLKKKYLRRVVFSLDPFLKNPAVVNFGNSHGRNSKIPQENLEKHFLSCINDLIVSKAEEGNEILAEIKTAVSRIKELIDQACLQAQKTENELPDSFRKKIQQLLENKEIDETKILTESAILSAKISVTEELNRLTAHFKRVLNIIQDSTKQTKGKELDFLMQEMLRETHTVISKTQSEELIDTVIEIRKLVDDIRQQIQNIE